MMREREMREDLVVCRVKTGQWRIECQYCRGRGRGFRGTTCVALRLCQSDPY